MVMAGIIIAASKWRMLRLPWKLIALELIIVFVAQSLALILALQHVKNTWLMNLFILVDLLCLGIAAILMIQSQKRQQIFIYLLALTCVLCCSSMLHSGMNTELNSLAFLTSGIYLSATYLLLLFQASTSDYPFRQPILWVSLGVILYFGCNVPFFSLFHYLSTDQTRWKKLGLYLYFINSALAIIRYAFVSYGFIKLEKSER